MKTKSFLFAFLLISLFGCVDVEDNKRSHIKGKILDGLENPVRDITIKSEARYNLGEDISDLQGNFDFTSLVSNAKYFKIKINERNSSSYNEEWCSVSYHFENKDLPNSFAFDTIRLNKKVNFHFKTERVSSTEPVYVVVKTVKPDVEYAVNFSHLGFEKYQVFTKNISPIEPDINESFEAVENTEVSIAYQIGNSATQQVNIPLNQSEVTYVLSY